MKSLMQHSIACCFASLLSFAAQVQAATITDLAGRTVAIPTKIDRIILGEGRMLTSLAILDRELPRQRIVGMLGDFEQLDPGSYAQYRKVYPNLDQVARLGRSSQSFSVEEAIALKPQLAIFSLGGHGPNENDHATMQRLSKAGISVIYVDFNKNIGGLSTTEYFYPAHVHHLGGSTRITGRTGPDDPIPKHPGLADGRRKKHPPPLGTTRPWI